ncbi:distal membrane-arm assembly complex protein 1 [Eublepharis macularius]|uniref:Distal membrane-arm assembly complex protein 1 n=1 Tax=Eublepharis macularius TaxID=481883 RepID=A0AA97KGQ7_EUBMA|nr:distal membrane-arm assembly complex protein 1 [Eublepharis macularius]
MSSKPSEVGPPAPHKPLFGDCWSCRLLSGLGLMAASVWVFMGPRRVMRQRIPPNMWHITQMTFAVGLFAWGAVVIADPVGRQIRKE